MAKISAYSSISGGPVFSNSYEFSIAANQISGSLATAGAKTITIRRVPKGVSGTNTNHYLYISGGTGTAEAVLITGGTAVGDAASGTLQFTTANTHTGAYRITSATAGMKEAFEAYRQEFPSGEDFRMQVPQGSHNVYARAVMADISVFITGEGQWATRINCYGLSLTTGCLAITNSTGQSYRCSVAGLGIWTGGSFTSTVPAIYVDSYPLGGGSDLLFVGTGLAIDWLNTSGGNPLQFSLINIYGGKQHGIRLRSTGAGQQAGTIDKIYFDGPGAAGIEISGTVAGFIISNVWFQSLGIGILIDATVRACNEILILNPLIDGPTIAGVECLGPSASGGTNCIRVTGGLIQHGATSIGFIAQQIQRVVLDGVQFNTASSGESVIVNTCDDITIDCNVYAFNTATAPNLIRLIGATNNVTLKGVQMSGDGTIAAGIALSAEAHSNVKIMGCSSSQAITAAVANGSTVKPVIYKGNLFTTNAVAAATIAAPAIDYGALLVLSGATPVTRMTGAFAGQPYFIKTISAVQFNTGGANPGNFAGAYLTSAGQTIQMDQDSATGVITITP